MPRGARLSAEGPLRPPSPRGRVLQALGAARLAGGNHGSRGKHGSEGHAAPTVGQGQQRPRQKSGLAIKLCRAPSPAHHTTRNGPHDVYKPTKNPGPGQVGCLAVWRPWPASGLWAGSAGIGGGGTAYCPPAHGRPERHRDPLPNFASCLHSSRQVSRMRPIPDGPLARHDPDRAAPET